jgi:hypothetical protein
MINSSISKMNQRKLLNYSIFKNICLKNFTHNMNLIFIIDYILSDEFYLL